ncbi:SIMPL domain-containing protein [Opitutaceae bacterium EW11]|nr:SIMPL domain-containing protein [Opitutaceae bacterium EW11]
MPSERSHLIGSVAGLALAAGAVLAAVILSSTWRRIAESQVVTVTGSAHRNVRSDLAVWHASFSADADSILEAQKRLTSDRQKVEAFLQANAVKDFAILPVQIREITAHSDPGADSVPVTIGYRLTRNVEVRSADVESLPRLSSDSTDLIQQGVVFASQGIDFIYTKAGDAKVEMMAEATKDARTRAEQIANQGGRTIKALRSAKMGVVQINPLYSSATSWEGNNDTTSIEKTITATVTATFGLQ